MLSFKIGTLDLYGTTNYRLNAPITGLDTPPYRVTSYDRPGEDGGAVSSALYGARPVALQGEVEGDTPATFKSARQALQAACAITRDSTGFPVLTRFTFTTLDGDSFFFDGQVTKLTMDLEEVTYGKFFINVVAPDPRLYKATATSSGLISPPVGGGFILPVILPITFSPSSGGVGSSNNTGNLLTYPTLTLRGQITNPYILNSTVGKSMQLNRVIAGGETVVIDMAQKTITLNGSTSLLTAKTSGSEWWGLQPGANNISFSSGSASDTGTLEVSWYNAVLGI